MQTTHLQSQTIRCPSGSQLKSYCKSLNCFKNKFMCRNKHCQCNIPHIKCPSYLKQDFSIFHKMINDRKRDTQYHQFQKNINFLIKTYEKLNENIIKQLLQLKLLKKAHLNQRSTSNIICQKLPKNQFFPMNGSEINGALKSYLLVTQSKTKFKKNLQKICRSSSVITEKISEMKNNWSFLEQTYNLDSENNCINNLLFSLGSVSTQEIPMIQQQLWLKRSVNNDFTQTKVGRIIRAEKLRAVLKMNACVTKLNLSHKNISNKQLQYVFDINKNLKELNINKSTITHEILAQVPNRLPNLQVFKCANLKNRNATSHQSQSQSQSQNDDILRIALKGFCALKNLIEFNISNLNATFKQVEGFLSKSIKKLRILNIQNSQVLDQGAFLISINFPNLIDLNIKNCGLTDVGFIALSKGRAKFQRLNVSNVPLYDFYYKKEKLNMITEDGIQVLCKNQTQLKFLDLYNLKLGKKGVIDVCLFLEQLRIIEINKYLFLSSQWIYMSKLRKLKLILEQKVQTSNALGLERFARNVRKCKVSYQYSGRYHSIRQDPLRFKIRNICILSKSKINSR